MLKLKLTEPESRGANLGARMAAAGFDMGDNPYSRDGLPDMAAAWQRGFEWCEILFNRAENMGDVPC